MAIKPLVGPKFLYEMYHKRSSHSKEVVPNLACQYLVFAAFPCWEDLSVIIEPMACIYHTKVRTLGHLKGNFLDTARLDNGICFYAVHT